MKKILSACFLIACLGLMGCKKGGLAKVFECLDKNNYIGSETYVTSKKACLHQYKNSITLKQCKLVVENYKEIALQDCFTALKDKLSFQECEKLRAELPIVFRWLQSCKKTEKPIKKQSTESDEKKQTTEERIKRIGPV